MLLAWDATYRLNWGARGAHVALSQLLTEEGETIETLSGTYQTKSYPAGYILPDRVAHPISRKREKWLGARVYDKLERMLGGKWDYLEGPPEAGADRMMQNREKAYFKEMFSGLEENETVVIDGNGDMIFKDGPTRNLQFTLAFIELADRLDKEIYYVNAIFSDCSMTGRNKRLADRCLEALHKCDGVSFRDPESLELARSMDEGLEAEWIPDSLFAWHPRLSSSRRHLPENGDFLIPYTQEHRSHFGRLDLGGPYICVTGGSRAAMSPDEAREGYCTLVNELDRLDLPTYLVPTSIGDQFLHRVSEKTDTPIIPAEVPILMGGAVLANARLFVTGRYHPAIMAASGGTPSVFLGADSHKTRSIQRVLEYDEQHVYSAVPDRGESEAIREHGQTLLEQGEALRDPIQQAAGRRGDETVRLRSLIESSA